MDEQLADDNSGFVANYAKVRGGEGRAVASGQDRRRQAGCGLVLDRDENAASVLASLYGSEIALKLVAASCAETLNACGAASSDHGNHALVKLTAMKQEPDRAVPAPLAT